MRLSIETQFCSVSVVPGFYITFQKLEVCNSMEHAYLELLGYSYTLTIATAFCSSEINRTDLMGVLPPRELYSKLHFCQCDRVDMQPWKWVPISKIRNGNGKTGRHVSLIWRQVNYCVLYVRTWFGTVFYLFLYVQQRICAIISCVSLDVTSGMTFRL